MSRSSEDKRPLLYLEEYKIKEAANDYGFADETFDINTFKRNLKIEIIKYSETEAEFDMIGVTPAVGES